MDLTHRHMRDLDRGMFEIVDAVKKMPVTEDNQQEMIALLQEMQDEDRDITRRRNAYEEMERMTGKVGDSPDTIEAIIVAMAEGVDIEGHHANVIKELKEKFEKGPEKEDEDEMEVVSATYSKKDPITKEDIKDPVKNSRCGHVYDRASIIEYIEMHKRNKQACYQCPVQGCANKVNLTVAELIDFPDFFKYCK